MIQNLLKGRRLQNQKQNACWHRLRMRENGGNLNFNFILLPNPAVDENWVCWHCLQQFIFEKWCHVQCFDLFNFLGEWHIYWMFPLCVCVCVCVQGQTFFLLFSSVHFIDRQLHSSYSIILAFCALDYAVRILHTTDTEYVILCVGWRKSLKDSATPAQYSSLLQCCKFDNNNTIPVPGAFTSFRL